MRWGVRWAGPRSQVADTAGQGLLCQAGVAIGLGKVLESHWQSEWADSINTVILASVVLYELIGPFLVRRTVVRAGEVKIITLMRPTADRPRPTQSGWMRFLRRYAGAGKEEDPGTGTQTGTLTARHLMRTNVYLLPAEATLDEVLHFVEQSRMHDFAVADADRRYLGIVHFSRIRDMVYDPTFAHLVTATDLADTDIPAALPDTPLPDLLELFNRHNTGELPVIEDTESGRLVGIVEQRDLLRALRDRIR